MFIDFNLAPGARVWTPGWSAEYRGIDVNNDICLIGFRIVIVIS